MKEEQKTPMTRRRSKQRAGEDARGKGYAGDDYKKQKA